MVALPAMEEQDDLSTASTPNREFSLGRAHSPSLVFTNQFSSQLSASSESSSTELSEDEPFELNHGRTVRQQPIDLTAISEDDIFLMGHSASMSQEPEELIPKDPRAKAKYNVFSRLFFL